MRTLSWPVVLLTLTLSAPALAQTGDKATAEVLFNEGRSLLQQGNYELACEKFAESQRLDPATGTLLNLADCQERLGRTASAWATWLEAAAAARAAGQGEREAHARQRAEALKPRLVTLTVEVPPENRITGLSVVRNGVSLGPALWGTAAPVDPGDYEVSAQAPGYEKWTTVVSVREGAPVRVVVPQLTPTPVEPSPPVQPAPSPAAPAPAPATEARGASISPLVWVLGGVGVVGVGVGSFFGLRAMSKDDASQDECRPNNVCSRRGVELRDEAFDAAAISTVGFAVGGVGLAAAAALWIVASGSSEAPASAGVLRHVSASVDPHGGGVAVQGRW